MYAIKKILKADQTLNDFVKFISIFPNDTLLVHSNNYIPTANIVRSSKCDWKSNS